MEKVSLQNLKKVGGYFGIFNNSDFEKLEISNFDEVGGHFDISHNEGLSGDMDVLESRMNMGADFYVCGNAPENGCGKDEC